MNGKPAYHLTKITADDFMHYFSLAGNAAVMAKITERAVPEPEARENYARVLKNNSLHEAFGSFKVTAADTGAFVGLGKLELKTADAPVAELGYMLLPEYWGMGIGDIVAKQLIAKAKTQPQLRKLSAIIDPSHTPSRKILVNNGFVTEEVRTIDGLPGEILGLRLSNPYFVWISGAINAGKSTVAKALAARLPYAVNIELDALSLFCPLDIDEQLDFIIKDALDLARNWTNRGFLPVLNWPLWGKEADYMLEYACAAGLRPVLINLTPPMEGLLRNRGSRELDDWELQRIAYMYAQNINEPAHGYRINNGEQTVAQTVEAVLSLIAGTKTGG